MRPPPLGAQALILVAIVAIAGTALFAGTPGRSSLSDGPEGLSGLAALLHESGVRVISERDGAEHLPWGVGGHVLVAAAGGRFSEIFSGTEHERMRLTEWVQRGNVLIRPTYAGDPWLEDLDLEWERAGNEAKRARRKARRKARDRVALEPWTLAPETLSRPTLVASRWDRISGLAARDVVLFGDGVGNPAGVLRRNLGKGRVILLVDRFPLENRGLAWGDNAAWILLAARPADGGVVIFDDWKDLGSNEGIVGYARDNGYALAFAQSWILALAFVAFAWLRPNRGLPETDEPPPREAADRARNLGNLYRRADLLRHVEGLLAGAFARRVAKRLRCAPDDLIPAMTRRSEEGAEELESILDAHSRLASAPLRDASAVRDLTRRRNEFLETWFDEHSRLRTRP